MDTTSTLDEDQILSEIAGGYYSPAAIAQRHGLSIEALLDWIESPRIAALLIRLRRFTRQRADIVADEKRSRGLSTLDEIIRAYEFDERNTPPARDTASLNARRHLRENARRSVALILRESRPARSTKRRNPCPHQTQDTATSRSDFRAAAERQSKDVDHHPKIPISIPLPAPLAIPPEHTNGAVALISAVGTTNGHHPTRKSSIVNRKTNAPPRSETQNPKKRTRPPLPERPHRAAHRPLSRLARHLLKVLRASSSSCAGTISTMA